MPTADDIKKLTQKRGVGAGLNPYIYASNNPVNFVDPDGMADIDPNDKDKVKGGGGKNGGGKKKPVTPRPNNGEIDFRDLPKVGEGKQETVNYPPVGAEIDFRDMRRVGEPPRPIIEPGSVIPIIPTMPGIPQTEMDPLDRPEDLENRDTSLGDLNPRERRLQETANENNARTESPATPTQPGQINTARLTRQLEIDEGRRSHVYTDTTGNRTIGIGFNLERSGAAADLARLGLSHNNVCAGRTDLTNQQIDTLFRRDLQEATQIARRQISNFDQLPAVAREVCINMAFQLGEARFRRFRNTRNAIERRQWNRAANGIENSLMGRVQAPNRSRRHANRLRALTRE